MKESLERKSLTVESIFSELEEKHTDMIDTYYSFQNGLTLLKQLSYPSTRYPIAPDCEIPNSVIREIWRQDKYEKEEEEYIPDFSLGFISSKELILTAEDDILSEAAESVPPKDYKKLAFQKRDRSKQSSKHKSISTLSKSLPEESKNSAFMQLCSQLFNETWFPENCEVDFNAIIDNLVEFLDTSDSGIYAKVCNYILQFNSIKTILATKCAGITQKLTHQLSNENDPVILINCIKTLAGLNLKTDDVVFVIRSFLTSGNSELRKAAKDFMRVMGIKQKRESYSMKDGISEDSPPKIKTQPSKPELISKENSKPELISKENSKEAKPQIKKHPTKEPKLKKAPSKKVSFKKDKPTTRESVLETEDQAEKDDGIKQPIAEEPTAKTEDKVEKEPTAQTEDKVEKGPMAETKDQGPIAETKDQAAKGPIAETKDKVEKEPDLKTIDKAEKGPIAETKDQVAKGPIAETKDKVEKKPVTATKDQAKKEPDLKTIDKAEKEPDLKTIDKAEKESTAKTEDKVEKGPIAETKEQAEKGPIAETKDKVEKKLVTATKDQDEKEPDLKTKDKAEKEPDLKTKDKAEKEPVPEIKDKAERKPVSETEDQTGKKQKVDEMVSSVDGATKDVAKDMQMYSHPKTIEEKKRIVEAEKIPGPLVTSEKEIKTSVDSDMAELFPGLNKVVQRPEGKRGSFVEDAIPERPAEKERRRDLDSEFVSEVEAKRPFTLPASKREDDFTKETKLRTKDSGADEDVKRSPKESGIKQIVSSTRNERSTNLLKKKKSKLYQPLESETTKMQILNEQKQRHELDLQQKEKISKLADLKTNQHFLVKDSMKNSVGRKPIRRSTQYDTGKDMVANPPQSAAVEKLRATLLPHSKGGRKKLGSFIKELNAIDRLPQKTTMKVPYKGSMLEPSDNISKATFQAQMQARELMEALNFSAQSSDASPILLDDVLFPAVNGIPPAAALPIGAPMTAIATAAATSTIPPVAANAALLPRTVAPLPPADEMAHRPAAATAHRPAAAIAHRPAAATAHRPAPSTVHPPAAATAHRPAATTAHPPAAATAHPPAAATAYPPAAATAHRPAPSTAYPPAAATALTPAAAHALIPAAATAHRPAAATAHRPAAATAHRSAAATAYPPAASTAYRPAAATAYPATAYPPAAATAYPPAAATAYPPADATAYPPAATTAYPPAAATAYPPAAATAYPPAAATAYPPAAATAYPPAAATARLSTAATAHPSTAATAHPSTAAHALIPAAAHALPPSAATAFLPAAAALPPATALPPAVAGLHPGAATAAIPSVTAVAPDETHFAKYQDIFSGLDQQATFRDKDYPGITNEVPLEGQKTLLSKLHGILSDPIPAQDKLQKLTKDPSKKRSYRRKETAGEHYWRDLNRKATDFPWSNIEMAVYADTADLRLAHLEKMEQEPRRLDVADLNKLRKMMMKKSLSKKEREIGLSKRWTQKLPWSEICKEFINPISQTLADKMAIGQERRSLRNDDWDMKRAYDGANVIADEQTTMTKKWAQSLPWGNIPKAFSEAIDQRKNVEREQRWSPEGGAGEFYQESDYFKRQTNRDRRSASNAPWKSFLPLSAAAAESFSLLTDTQQDAEQEHKWPQFAGSKFYQKSRHFASSTSNFWSDKAFYPVDKLSPWMRDHLQYNPERIEEEEYLPSFELKNASQTAPEWFPRYRRMMFSPDFYQQREKWLSDYRRPTSIIY